MTLASSHAFWARLEVDPDVLRKAAHPTRDMQHGVNTGSESLKSAHEGINGSAEGFAFAGELNKLLNSWSARLHAVSDECDYLADLLPKTAKDYEDNEAAVKSSFPAKPTAATRASKVDQL